MTNKTFSALDENPETIAILLAKNAWESLTDEQLAAAFLSSTFGGSPKIDAAVIAYLPARKLGLIDERGNMHEVVFEALKLAVKRIRRE